ncbi:unnamed protein product [Rotaria magnacalcarata]|uniref:UBC core domain-containing protein n=2 Tax=Rotaria magnacalcarata TaxID=392030 RepID=A0A816GIL3_9BILA|nr:unnamed protein product [Rotaria magnacalcarata]CAF2067303.1 unnamed protein product [Rotaria magnacalcarata]
MPIKHKKELEMPADNSTYFKSKTTSAQSSKFHFDFIHVLDYFISTLSMPISAPQVWKELTRLRLLGPNGQSPGIFIVDESPFKEEDGEEATASDEHDFIAGRILPTADIYKEGAYRLEMKFSSEYPFKPPEVRFTTPIYHLNVDKDGLVCIPILRATEDWTANTSLADVVKAIVDIINHPKIDYAMSPEIHKEYLEKRDEYERKAREMVREKALPRT